MYDVVSMFICSMYKCYIYTHVHAVIHIYCEPGAADDVVVYAIGTISNLSMVLLSL